MIEVIHHSFTCLKAWLASFDDQTTGDPAAICQTGEPYVQFFASGLARPADVAAVEEVVAKNFHRQIEDYLNQRSGRIYWRTPFEHETTDTYVIERFDVNGPDTDPITDRKCFQDKNWKLLRCYARLYRATCRTVDVNYKGSGMSEKAHNPERIDR